MLFADKPDIFAKLVKFKNKKAEEGDPLTRYCVA